MSVRFAAPALIAAFANPPLRERPTRRANVMKECGTQYQAAKAANQLAGKSWNQYRRMPHARFGPAGDRRLRPGDDARGQPLKPAPAPQRPPLHPAAAANRRRRSCGGKHPDQGVRRRMESQEG